MKKHPFAILCLVLVPLLLLCAATFANRGLQLIPNKAIPARYVLLVSEPQTSGKCPQKMSSIPSGDYMAGYGGRQDDEKPVHPVLLDTFCMDKYEVTQAEYERRMGENPSGFKGSNHPVEQVTWQDAKEYCVIVGKRLPTEAEWEKAARGGKDTTYPWGNEMQSGKANFCDANCEYAWRKKQFDDGYKETAPVGSYPANGYGLYDMAGNVEEWVSDWYGESYYRRASRNNPKGPSSGEFKVLRGGSWGNFPYGMRPAYRSRFDPARRDDYIGFRCVGLASSMP